VVLAEHCKRLSTRVAVLSWQGTARRLRNNLKLVIVICLSSTNSGTHNWPWPEGEDATKQQTSEKGWGFLRSQAGQGKWGMVTLNTGVTGFHDGENRTKGPL